ncbi:acyl-CoA-binding protein [Gammaproteobacteria bacterium AS21]|jgi:acyl-CoA-binding protein
MEQLQKFNEMASFLKDHKTKPQPSNQFKLKMYGLYKQATLGNVSIDQPNPLDMIASAKFLAWQKLTAMDCQVAMQAYIDEALAFKAQL